MCYNCAAENVRLEKRMYEGQSVDLTWVFLHQVYTVTLTIIWAMYNPEIRRLNPKHEVEELIRSQIELLVSLSGLWPGAEAAADLFARLAGAALRNYDSDLRNSPATTHSSVTPPPQQRVTDRHSPYSQPATSPYVPSYTPSEEGRSVSDRASPPHAASGMTTFTSVYEQPNILETAFPATTTTTSQTSPAEPSYRDFQGMIFDPNFMNSMFAPTEIPGSGIPDWLQQWDPSVEFGQQQHPVQGENYLPQTEEVLNQQAQHDELMRILESEAVQGFGFGEPQQQRTAWEYSSEVLF